MKVPTPKKTKNGWYIRLRLNGVYCPVRASDRTECIHMAQKLKANYMANKRLMQKTSSAITLSQAIDRYIERKRAALSPSTIRNYRIIQKNRFQDYMYRPFDSIRDWQAVYNSELNNVAPKTLKNSFGLLRSVYENETGQKMPTVYMTPVPKNERPFLDADQIRQFCDALRGESCEIAALLALSSLRCSEILALRWERVDLTKRRILVSGALVRDEHGVYIEKATNKTEASHRYVPIFIPQLHDALNAVEDKTGRVVDFSSHGLFCAINRVCRKAGVPEVGIHGLRHSFASLAVHLQMPEEVAMSIGGWSDFSTMRKIYTHISQSDMNAKTAKFAEFFATENRKIAE